MRQHVLLKEQNMDSALRIFPVLSVLVFLLLMAGCVPSGDISSVIGGTPVAESYDHYDAKTGTYITGTQDFWYSVCDGAKGWGGIVVAVLFTIGFLIRRIDHENAAFRRFGFVLDVIIPILYVLVLYTLCYLVDRYVG